MDELVIQSKFLRNMIGNFIRRFLVRKYKCVANVDINTLKVLLDNGNADIHLDLNISCGRGDLEKFIEILGRKGE